MARRRLRNDGVVSLCVVLLAGGAFWWWLSRAPVETPTVTPGSTSSVRPTVTTRPSPSPTLPAASTSSAVVVPAGTYRVQWVFDGDTIAIADAKGVRLGNVRILGLNAPELAHNGKPAECFGAEATTHLRALLQDKEVRLVDDSRAPKRDRYLRRLAYVEIGRADVATHMIKGGWAVEFHLPSAGPGDRTPTYLTAQEAAVRAKSGLWGACPAHPDPTLGMY